MPLDTFICGNCQGAFCDIDSFMNHKKDGCSMVEQPEVIQVHVAEELTSLNDGSAIPLVSVSEAGTSTELKFYNETGGVDNMSGNVLTGEITTGDQGQQTLVIIKEEVDNQTTSDKATCTMDMEKEPPKIPKKKGRPRLSTKKTKITPLVEVKKEGGRPPLPEPGPDGKYVCVRCKRSFNKERYFNTHKCLSDDYVDITKKEVFAPEVDGEDDEQDAGEIEDDNIDEYTAPIVLDVVESNDELMEEIDKIEKFEKTTFKQKPVQLDQVEIITDPDGENSTRQKITDSIEDLPVFINETEKLEFEASLNVDLSGMDTMFSKHSIEQELDEGMTGLGKNIASELIVYVCNVCSKVFKTLSHIRLHCLIHTDMKPFKCPNCDYSSNSKGNLYTHMRRHTGQFYHCQKCPFHTVNKSHLVEHEATHSTTRHLCNLCKKDYNTQKSLINHIRKYHCDNDKGKEYLNLFLNRRNSQSHVIHQCHVCNRKFKKKIDRDRHLFVHDIRDIPTIQKCELCDYTASRRLYLEKHYLKHRIVYFCSSCPSRFLSSVRLIDHLNSNHLNSDLSTTWETLFEECINNSIYLPEPDDKTKLGYCTEIVNLPHELSKTSLDLSDAKQSASSDTAAPSSSTCAESKNSDSITIEQLTNGDETEPIESTNRNEEMMETDSPLVINNMTDSNIGQSSVALDQSQDTDQDMSADVLPDSTEHLDADTDMDTKPTIEVDNPDLNNSETDTDVDPDTKGSDAAPDFKGSDVNSDTKASDVDPDTKASDVGPDTEGSNVDPDNKIDSPTDVDNGTDEATKKVEDGSDIVMNTDKGNNSDKNDATESETETTKDIPVIALDQQDNEGLINIIDDSADTPQTESPDKPGDLNNIINKLGYREMNMDIFHKMRETFGSEECEYCGRLFYSKSDFEAHLRIHTGERPYQCEQCSFRGLNSNVLKKHIEKEHQKLLYECGDCEYTTFKRGALWNHRIKHLTVVGLQCPKCPDKFDSMKNLRSHLLQIHPNIEMEELEKLTGYKHRLHGKMGRRSYKCPYCERIFTRANSELQKHIWMHEGIKPFKCSLCVYSCRSKNNLQAHMLRHSSEKPFNCEECGKAYKSRTALRWHVRSHKEGKMFKCHKCPYEATQRSHLTRHMETHDVIKRFVCQMCYYSANTLQFMKIHYSRHHKGEKFDVGVADSTKQIEQNSEAKVFKCLSCDYLFGNMSELKRHLRVRHHVQAQDMANLESMEMSEVQVVQYVDENPTQGDNIESSQTMVTELQQQQPQATQIVDNGNELDEKTVSAVSLLQQIMNMSNPVSNLNGGFIQQQLTLVNEDGQMVAVNPDTIIVQETGEEVLVADGQTHADGNQYVIQYVSQPTDTPQIDGIPQEIITSEEIQQ